MRKQRGMKMLMWIGLALMGLIAAAAVYFLSQFNARKTEMADAILAKPEVSAVVSYTIDEEGEPVEDGYGTFYNADTPLVVGSTMKLVVLAAYELAIAGGDLDPLEQVAVTELERYYLPGTDGGAHAAGLASLGLAADPLGFARDQNARIALDDVARIMISYSGNAETDLLIARLGADRIGSVLQSAGMEHHSPIQPILGITLALLNHEQPLIDEAQRLELVQAVAREDFSTMNRLIDLYLHDPAWRKAQLDWMQSSAFTSAVGQMGWEGQVQASLLFPKGTARSYARMMARIAGGTLFSPEVSRRMQQKLENIPSDWPLRLLFHRRYGAKDGVTAGVLSLASYAVPKNGKLAGRTRVVVVITNELPAATWSAQVRDQGLYLFQTDLARASGVFGKLAGR